MDQKDDTQRPHSISKDEAKPKPEKVLRDGAMKSTIWANESEHGRYYQTRFAKTFTDNKGNTKDGQSFSTSDLLKLSELARKSYDQVRDLERQDRQNLFHQKREGKPRQPTKTR